MVSPMIQGRTQKPNKVQMNMMNLLISKKEINSQQKPETIVMNTPLMGGRLLGFSPGKKAIDLSTPMVQSDPRLSNIRSQLLKKEFIQVENQPSNYDNDCIDEIEEERSPTLEAKEFLKIDPALIQKSKNNEEKLSHDNKANEKNVAAVKSSLKNMGI